MPSPLSSPFILLVEDSEDDAYFFNRVVRQSGLACKLVHLGDGEAAIEALKRAKCSPQERPDLIFLDLKLPGYGGFEVLQWIREQRFDPPLEVAILSGSDHEVDVARAKALGVTYYFAKPLTIEQLRSVLPDTILEKARVS